MKLYMPTIVYYENGCVKKHGKELASLGTKALIVTGKRSSRLNGSLFDVEEVLNENQVPYVIYDDIEENPSVETVMKARNFGLKHEVDFVIGIGGGSPMDASKAIALMISNPNQGEDILYQPINLPCMPVVAVPTTAGTGSEVTPYSILTLHDQRTKRSISHRIFPQLALVDSSYLKTANRECLVNTAVDALAHLVESYLNTNTNAMNRMYSERGLMIWGTSKEALRKGTLTEEDYENLMQASMLGGMAIAHTGTSLPHGMSYAITYERNVPHGKAVGIFLAGYVRIYQNQEEAMNVLKLLGFASHEEFSDYLHEILGSVEVEQALYERDVKELMSQKAKLANYPYPITEKELFELL